MIKGKTIKLIDNGDSYTWDGNGYSSEDKVYDGKFCMPIAPDIDINDCLFSFNKQLLLDVGLTLQCENEFQSPSPVDVNKRKMQALQ